MKIRIPAFRSDKSDLANNAGSGIRIRGCSVDFHGKQKGVTLLELLTVVAIVAILASIALPSYDRYVKRTRRADGREALMRVAAAQERFYTNRNSYSTDIAADLSLPTTSESGYYEISTDSPGGDNQIYVLTATPQGVQATDTCGALTINNTGFKDAPDDTGTNGACW